MSRQQRRAAERAAAKANRRETFDRVHGQVLAGKTIRDMWVLFARERFERFGIQADSDESRAVLEPTFYAGFAACLELMMRVSPDDVSEEVGVEMLNRLHEELDTYTKGRTGH